MNDDLDVEVFGEKSLEAEHSMILFKDTDGNWRGMMKLNGKVVQARQIGPETVLQLLLTHDGQIN